MYGVTTAPATAGATSVSWPRLALTVALAAYGIPLLRHPDQGSLVDGVDLAIHETGHLLFAPLGEFMQFAGGTVAQLVFPLVFAVYFWRHGDRHAATVATWWHAQNWWNVSVYVNDARDLQLDLVGGGEHDWNYLLDRVGVLHLDHRLARAAWLVGLLVFLASTVLGARWARVTPAGERSYQPG